MLIRLCYTLSHFAGSVASTFLLCCFRLFICLFGIIVVLGFLSLFHFLFFFYFFLSSFFHPLLSLFLYLYRFLSVHTETRCWISCSLPFSVNSMHNELFTDHLPTTKATLRENHLTPKLQAVTPHKIYPHQVQHLQISLFITTIA